jgi:hypothetical protein
MTKINLPPIAVEHYILSFELDDKPIFFPTLFLLTLLFLDRHPFHETITFIRWVFRFLRRWGGFDGMFSLFKRLGGFRRIRYLCQICGNHSFKLIN